MQPIMALAAGTVVGATLGFAFARRLAALAALTPPTPAAPSLGDRLQTDAGRAALRALVEAPFAARDGLTPLLEKAWKEGIRDAVVRRRVDGLPEGLDPDSPRRVARAGAELLRRMAESPATIRAINAALLQGLRLVPVGRFLPNAPAQRDDAIAGLYHRLVKPRLLAWLSTVNLAGLASVSDIVASLDDEILRRTTASLLRILSRDKDRLRKLHTEVGEAFGEEKVASVGPFELTVKDVLRRFVTPADLQTRMTKASAQLEKPANPRLRQLRLAGVELSTGWLEAWVSLATEQRLRAATALHDRLFPIVFPVVTAAFNDAVQDVTLGDVLEAADASGDGGALLRELAAVIEDERWLADAPVVLRAFDEAWRAIDRPTREAFVGAVIDATSANGRTLVGDILHEQAASVGDALTPDGRAIALFSRHFTPPVEAPGPDLVALVGRRLPAMGAIVGAASAFVAALL